MSEGRAWKDPKGSGAVFIEAPAALLKERKKKIQTEERLVRIEKAILELAQHVSPELRNRFWNILFGE